VKQRIFSAIVFLAASTGLVAAEPSLVPDTPSTAPDYFCTWNVQGLPPLPRKVIGSTLLTGGVVTLAQSDPGIAVDIDPAHHRAVDTVVALELDGNVMDLKPIPGHAGDWESLTVDAAAVASSSAKSWAGMPPDCVVLHSWEKEAPKSVQGGGQAGTPAPPPQGLAAQLDDQPAQKWTEALPLGNGRLGAMVFGSQP